MNKIFTESKTKSLANRVAIPMAIVITISTLYYLLTMATPAFSFTQGLWPGFRIANTLWALAIVTPYAGLGIAVGSVYNGGTVGTLFTGLHWLTPAIATALAYAIWKLAQYGPKQGWRYHVKNIVLLIVFTAIMAVAVRFSQTLGKFPGAAFSPVAIAFFVKGIIGKVISMNVAALLGYPLIGMWNRVSKKLKERFE